MVPESKIRRVVGCMTGTSIDGIDAALVEITGVGLHMRATLVRSVSRPLGSLSTPLRRLADQHPMTAGDIAQISHAFSILHRDTMIELLRGERADLISIHGQTVWHAPPTSWQMLTPAVIAHALHTPVVSDLRAADLATGGQGAPITPLADFVLFRDTVEPRTILNLGGFCNFTWLPAVPRDAADLATYARQITGGDICACNHLLNGVARSALGCEYDRDGAVAATGRPSDALVREICARLAAQSRARRSLGSGDELLAWLDELLRQEPAANVLRATCEAIAATIAAAAPTAQRVIVGGGGTHNRTLLDALTRHAKCPVEPCTRHGVEVGQREAAEMAILGALCQDRIPITLSSVVNATDDRPIAGQWTLP
ncbi:MAG: anhydro-N-acetylmuramic acid kinase [Phycisphaerae bacterium]